jgi:DNA mismatch repair ATPase MutS
MTHPGVKMKNMQSKGKKRFVPNSTYLCTKFEPARSLLVTGPNMGGKSTLLR